MGRPNPPPVFDIFFSDDQVAVIDFMPPPPQPPAGLSTFFLNSRLSPSLRGSVSYPKSDEAQHPCMSCASDLQNLCPTELAQTSNEDSLSASFHRQMCLMRHADDLSESCATTMSELEDNLVTMCYRDIDHFCGDVSPGNSKVHSCLASHHCDLTSSCQSHLERSTARLPTSNLRDKPTLSTNALDDELSMVQMMRPPSLSSGLLGGVFEMMNQLLNEEPAQIGGDPHTWNPTQDKEEPAQIGGDPHTWTPAQDKEDPAQIGGDPDTWTPAQDKEEPAQIGGDPHTWTPAQDKEEPVEESDVDESVVDDTNQGQPALLGGDKRTWSPSSPSNMHHLAPPDDNALMNPGAVMAPKLTLSGDKKNGPMQPPLAPRQKQQPLGSDPHTWSPKSPQGGQADSGPGPTRGRNPLMGSDPRTWSPPNDARKEAALVATTSVEVPKGGEAAAGEEEESSPFELMRLGLVAAGAASSLLVLGAVTSRASRNLAQRRARNEWHRTFAPALLG